MYDNPRCLIRRYIHYSECGFFGKYYETLDEAKEEWNRRSKNE